MKKRSTDLDVRESLHVVGREIPPCATPDVWCEMAEHASESTEITWLRSAAPTTGTGELSTTTTSNARKLQRRSNT